MSSNELGRAASPYLLQHANNPVHWRLWSEAALREAQESNKPILLSVGYAACHWCHVMAHESFEDAETAAVMNELFVNIKVDREERPDIDHIYMSALHSFGERGGWPMTMFLAPNGEPFWGGTYFPKTEQYGRPAFVTVLRSVAEVFRTEPEKIAQNTTIIREALTRRKQSEGSTLTADLLDSLPPQIAGFVDPANGGLRGAPKFPNTPIFELLWRAGAHLGKSPYRDLVRLTLTRMSQGGIYDHLGGGYARYSVDTYWRVPHFEKMLYDNAQLLELLALCHREYGDPLLRQRVSEIVAWLSREMTTPEGAFCASLDADSEGEEGRFYVWSWVELVSVLGEEDARFFGRFYDAGPAGNWDEEPHGKIVTVLNQLKADPPSPEEEARLASLRQKLFLVREQRSHPGLDDKIMADWNGLMIAALVNAGTALSEPAWIGRAARAYAAVVDLLQYTNAAGRRRLAHSTRADAIVKPGFALDHAAMLRAALTLHEARHMTGADLPAYDYLADAISWAEAVRDDYLDRETGLLAMSTADAGDVILRLSPTNDDAIPNAHPVYLTGLIRLAALSGDDTWLTLADQLMATLAPVVRDNFAGHTGILNALDLRLNGIEIVTAGKDRKTLYEAALAIPFDRRIVIDLDRPEAFPDSHPAAAQAKMAGSAAAFVCTKGACSAPVKEAAGLQKLIAEL
jgi:hypothetical protein